MDREVSEHTCSDVVCFCAAWVSDFNTVLVALFRKKFYALLPEPCCQNPLSPSAQKKKELVRLGENPLYNVRCDIDVLESRTYIIEERSQRALGAFWENEAVLDEKPACQEREYETFQKRNAHSSVIRLN